MKKCISLDHDSLLPCLSLVMYRQWAFPWDRPFGITWWIFCSRHIEYFDLFLIKRFRQYLAFAFPYLCAATVRTKRPRPFVLGGCASATTVITWKSLQFSAFRLRLGSIRTRICAWFHPINMGASWAHCIQTQLEKPFGVLLCILRHALTAKSSNDPILRPLDVVPHGAKTSYASPWDRRAERAPPTDLVNLNQPPDRLAGYVFDDD